MGRRTIIKGENQTLNTGSVMIAFQTAAALAAGGNIRLKRIEISQSGSVTLAMIRAEVATRDTGGTLTTTSLAPTAYQPATGPASGIAGSTSVIGGTARSGITSSADSGGTYTTIMPFNFANLNGYLWKPDKEEEIWIPPSTVCVIRAVSAPGTLTGWTFTAVLDEE